MRKLIHDKFFTALLFILLLTSYSWAAKWETFKFDSDISGKLAQLQHYCNINDITLADVLWANKINSSEDITAGTEIFLPANKNDMLAIWQNRGAWQPTALIPVTSKVAANRAANIDTTPTPQVPEVKLPEPVKPSTPPIPQQIPSRPEVSPPTQTQEIDLQALLNETQNHKARSRKDMINDAIRES